jgi:hypothetical protein
MLLDKAASGKLSLQVSVLPEPGGNSTWDERSRPQASAEGKNSIAAEMAGREAKEGSACQDEKIPERIASLSER